MRPVPDSTPEIACCGGWGGVWIPASGLGGPGDPGVKVFRTPFPRAVGGDAVSLDLILTPFSVSLLSACVSYLWSLLVTPLFCAPSLLLGSSVGCRFSVCVGVCLLFLSPCRCQHFLCVFPLLSLSPLWLCRLSAFLLTSFWAPFHFPLCLPLPPTCLSPPHFFLPLLDPHHLPLSPGTHSLGLPPTSGA